MKSYTSAEVAELDRHAIEDLGVDIKQLMEVAGLRSAEAAVRLFGDNKSLTVLVGSGGNGGDALVCAKFLKLWGYEVSVMLSHEEEELRQVTKDQLYIWRKFGGGLLNVERSKGRKVPMNNDLTTLRLSDISTDGIIDGLLGYSLVGDPRGKSAELIEWTNSQNCQVLSLDVPSGLDATTGEARDPCIKANMTVVYGVMKKGLLVDSAKDFAGEIELVDIGLKR